MATKLTPMEVLASLQDGRFLADLGDQIQNLTQAVRETRKGGRITITLEVKPAVKSATSVVMTPAIAIKRPVPETEGRIFFLTEAGGLSREHPNQGRMFADEERSNGTV